jgi:integrin beta 3
MPGGAMPGGPAGAGPGGPRVRLAASVEAIRGARSEVRRQLREQQRLRMWTLIATVVLVVGALPFYFVLQAATRDPVLTSLDALSVPSWAVTSKDDNIGGSRWCLLDCRYRERTLNSSHPVEETAKVYQDALRAAGWRMITGVPGCPPEAVEGQHESCWRRDEFTLDLWVREPSACSEDPLNKRPTVAPPTTGTPSADPSAAASESPPPPAGPSPNDVCAGSTVTMKVRNAIADERLQFEPESTPTPDPNIGNLTDEDLQPTEEPSSTPSAG